MKLILFLVGSLVVLMAVSKHNWSRRSSQTTISTVETVSQTNAAVLHFENLRIKPQIR